MGRKTFESILEYIGKPLPNRVNIVVTQNPDFKKEGIVISNSLEDAINKAKKSENREIFIIGGAHVFREVLEKGIVNRIYLTKVEGDFSCDTFFPDYSQFKKVVSEETGESNGIKFRFITNEEIYHIGRIQIEALAARIQLHVGKNRDGVAALDDALHVAQGLQQRGPLDCQFHDDISSP